MKEPKGRAFYFPLFSFYFFISTFASAQVNVVPDTAKLVPPETVLLVNVGSFSRLKEQFEKTIFYKLYKDPTMAAFVEDCKNRLREKIRKANSEIVSTVIDSGVLPEGRAAFGLVLNKRAMDAREPTALFIIQWGENCSKIKEAIEKQVEKAIENGAHQKSEDYRGISIKTMIGEDSLRLGLGFSSTLNYCFIDDYLIGSEDIEILKFVIAHIKGAGSPVLADDDDYKAAKWAVGPYHDIECYVNIKQIIKTILAENTTGKTKTTIDNLGFDNVTFFGCSVGVSRQPDSSCSGKGFLRVGGGKKGVCKMLEAESALLRVPRFIPASTCSATFFNLNIKKAYNELVNVLTSFSPEAATVMLMPLLPPSPEGEPGLELKRDIIDHLGSQIVFAKSINKPLSDSSTRTESIVALAVNDRKALEKSLSLLHDKLIAANNPDAKRELLGHTIYLVSIPGLPFSRPGVTPMQNLGVSTARPTFCYRLQNTAPVQMPTLAFTVTDTHLIFGIESTVERAIRALGTTGTASLSSAKWFTSAKLAIPSAVGLAGLQDNAAAGEFSWRMMKKTGKSSSEDSAITMGIGMSSSFGLIFSQTGLDLFNFSLLPEFDTVRKYFGLSAFYGISRPDGFFFEFKYLDPSNAE